MTHEGAAHDPAHAHADERRARTGTTAARVVWLAGIAILWWLSGAFAGGHDQFVWGAAAWPRGVLLIAALAVLGQWWGERGEAAGAAHVEARDVLADVPRARLVMTFAVPLLYMLALSHIGFFIATPLFLGLYMSVFGERRWIHLIATNALFCVIVSVIFSRLLYVPLPLGEWPLFHDASQSILALLRAGG